MKTNTTKFLMILCSILWIIGFIGLASVAFVDYDKLINGNTNNKIKPEPATSVITDEIKSEQNAEQLLEKLHILSK